MKKTFKKMLSITLCSTFCVGILSSCGNNNEPQPTKEPIENIKNVKSSDLIQTGEKQERWLSIPDSRLVLNPFNFESGSNSNKPQTFYSNRPSMPLNVGYLDPYIVNRRGYEMNDAVVVLEKDDSQTDNTSEVVWQGDTANLSQWAKTEDGDTEVDNGGIKIISKKKADPVWQGVTISGNVEFDDDTYVVASVRSCTGFWALKLIVDGQYYDLKGDNKDIGTFGFNPKKDFGIEGAKNFQFLIFSIGADTNVVFDSLKIIKGKRFLSEASEYSTTWEPHKLGFEAKYSNGMSISGKDFFYDDKTIIREISCENGEPTLAGSFSGAASVSGNTLLVKNETYTYAISINQKGRFVFAEALSEAQIDGKFTDTPTDKSTSWMYVYDDFDKSKNIVIAFSLDTKLVDAETIAGMASNAANDANVTDKLNHYENYWNDFLSKVPIPGSFSFEEISDLDVTFGDIKLNYYECFVYVGASLLPPNPEVGYNYRQLSAGKSAMWGYGEENSSYTASWDSSYGIMLLAYIEPEIAWDCYEGIISSIEEDGMLGGESLPTLKARLAWILNTFKPDKERLERIYDKLEVNLEWCMEHPFWIYMDVANPITSRQRDVDFSAACLVDIPYFIKITEFLGKNDHVEKWNKLNDEFYEKFLIWTFPPKGGLPTQYYNSTSDIRDKGLGARGEGNAIWVTKALHVPQITDEYVERLMELFKKHYRANSTFAGFDQVKQEEIAYTIYGLMDRGYFDYAKVLVETEIRDIFRTGWNGEGYRNSEMPECQGVRPSMFGIAAFVEGVLLRNGYRIDEGLPIVTGMFKKGSVENIHIDGKVLNIFVDTEAGKATLSGSYVGDTEKVVDIAEDSILRPFH